MTYYITKVVVTAFLVVAISEIGKRSTLVGGFVASLPLVSVLAMIWLYVETNDAGRAAALSSSIFWLVLPSLSLFVMLPILLRSGLGFYVSLSLSIATMAGCYAALVAILERTGIRF